MEKEYENGKRIMRMEWYRKEFLGVRTEATESSCGRSERVYNSRVGVVIYENCYSHY